ncbi:MAG: hypothetical protein HQK49_18800 [Oligoflexia bacterium]|nr:hypothetical protein [Oligoflexia bacterium]
MNKFFSTFLVMTLALLISTITSITTNALRAENNNPDEFLTETRIIKAKSATDSKDLKLFLGDGRIANIIAPSEETIATINQAIKNKSTLQFVLKENTFQVVSFEPIKLSAEEKIEALESTTNFLRSTIAPNNNKYNNYGYETAVSRARMEQLFRSQHEDFRGSRIFIRRNPSQCFRRAHVWSFEMEMDYSVISGKFFLMYGELCQDQWWFHVTPYVVLSENGRNIPMAMDKEYLDYPKDVHSWSKEFVNIGNGRCRMLEYNQYNTYLREKSNACCHIIKTTRFYFYPDDMEAASNSSNNNITGWTNLNNAYSEYYPTSGRRY